MRAATSGLAPAAGSAPSRMAPAADRVSPWSGSGSRSTRLRALAWPSASRPMARNWSSKRLPVTMRPWSVKAYASMDESLLPPNMKFIRPLPGLNRRRSAAVTWPSGPMTGPAKTISCGTAGPLPSPDSRGKMVRVSPWPMRFMTSVAEARKAGLVPTAFVSLEARTTPSRFATSNPLWGKVSATLEKKSSVRCRIPEAGSPSSPGSRRASSRTMAPSCGTWPI